MNAFGSILRARRALSATAIAGFYAEVTAAGEIAAGDETEIA